MLTKKIAAGLTAFVITASAALLPLPESINGILGNTAISAQAYSANGAVKMPSDFLTFNSSDQVFVNVVSATKNGLYYYTVENYKKLIKFYSFSSNSVRTVATLGDIINVYANNSKIYYIERDTSTYNSSVKGSSYSYYIKTFDTDTEKVTKSVNVSKYTPNGILNYPNCFGVDDNGRIYYYVTDSSGAEKGDNLFLLDSNGNKLSSCSTDVAITKFSGFDSTNGNFYFERNADYVYWGYTHKMNALGFGNISNNKITVSDKSIDYFYQKYYDYHYDNAQMLGNGKLAWTSSASGTVNIVDSAKFHTSTDDTLYLFGSVSRAEHENKNDLYNSVGTRTVYNSENDSTIMYVNHNTLMEFNNDFKQVASYKTAYPVFALYYTNGTVTAIERDTDGNFYSENIAWKMPSSVTISNSSATLKTGDSLKLSAKGNSDIDYGFTWSSSDNSVASVTKDGKVYGNKAGVCTITATTDNSVKASCTVTVTPMDSDTKGSATLLSGRATYNASDNHYNTWSSVTNSYLVQNSDGTLTRLENTSSGIVVENYSADGKKLISQRTISKELNLFGGFYSGKDYNYLVFGQNNTFESDSKEVVRVVKYTKSWSKVNSCSISGVNTTKPFSAGSLRMEEAGGKLYVYTCHEMYADSDGINHQANMLFTIDESSMSLTDSMYDVSNLTDGYVSHSFNQFIKADESGKYIYRVDHSESSNYTMNGSYLSVNGITLTKYKADGKSTAVSVSIPVKFDMNKSNYTGASIGGFELGSGNCLIAYAKDVSSSCKTRNVYISVTDELFNGTQNIALTNYGTSSKVTCHTPQLIKINDNLFLVMWEEYNSSTGKTATKTMTVDSNGKTVTKAISHSFGLSDCQPVVCSDGMVKWYVTNNSAPTLYKLSPFALDDYHEHSYTKTVLSNATCTTAGTVKYTCSCGDSYTETIPATGHKSSGWIVDKTASIGVKGSKHKECTVCKKVLETAEIPALSRISISKASVTLSTSTYAYDGKAKKPGVMVKLNGKTLKNGTDYTVSYSNNTKVGTAKVTITGKGNYTGSVSKTYSIKNNFKKATVSGISNKSYTGKNITQSITVKYNGKTLKNGTDYTVSYSNNKNIGTAAVKIAGKGSYTGTITKTFKINPAKQAIQKLTAKSKAFFVDWAQKGSATGYEIQYATNSKFTSAKKVTITNNKTDTKTISKLSGKKKYYVRVRSYTTVKGTKYYGAWSVSKSVTTKK
ncbi:Ig-like domain-containing protein [Ruminococcus bicirculans]|uniref:Ig-like domain-containing protein n=1 Tax=Ruminococcus bicirculans (ex Wegman et al. 2014) TaxID=1160721 RepID=A0AAW6ECS9_9FIRM|nr:Ig-like domain-containing protein [Ruminococcus bicirculans (ex Wegman et al. 2014)]MDB8749568.1 Ig-like domain-containing protein [Ruminococcus bicirculans (ex Wegman et al. 2014)]